MQELREQLRDAQETLDAIRTGQVDALVVSGGDVHKVYSLSGAEEPYRVYFEHMQEGAVTLAGDGLILYCNQRFADMVNLPLGKVIGSNLAANLSASSLLRVTAVAHLDKVGRHETVLLRGGKKPLPVKLTASKLTVGGFEVICLVVTDLTDQREKAELRVAREVAERASAAKDEFLAKLSHELRTPLTPTLMLAGELERNATLPEKVRQDIAMIRRNTELEARLIDDLLDLTRIAGGKLELRLRPADLHTLIQRAVSICQGDVDAKEINLELTLEAPHVHIEVDTVRVQQAVWNLIRNAIKFTPAGGTISIGTGNAGGRAWVAVRDTGIGFAPEMAPKLFRAFEQGGQQITRKFGGLGLGLAITRSIVESHGGTVGGESAGPGRGATFTLQLPTSAARAAEEPASPQKPAAAGHTNGTRALSILLVEDHNDTRFTLELILTRGGHAVKSASTVAAALMLAEAHAFDLVISDLGLPDQSGLEMMTQLRDRYGLRGIAVSGFGMEEDIARSRGAGFSYHLTKPINMDGLKKLIAAIGREVAEPAGSVRD